ncbi:hypothetical protein ACFE04_028962 [Oxalis oulophora]
MNRDPGCLCQQMSHNDTVEMAEYGERILFLQNPVRGNNCDKEQKSHNDNMEMAEDGERIPGLLMDSRYLISFFPLSVTQAKSVGPISGDKALGPLEGSGYGKPWGMIKDPERQHHGDSKPIWSMENRMEMVKSRGTIAVVKSKNSENLCKYINDFWKMDA